MPVRIMKIEPGFTVQLICLSYTIAFGSRPVLDPHRVHALPHSRESLRRNTESIMLAGKVCLNGLEQNRHPVVQMNGRENTLFLRRPQPQDLRQEPGGGFLVPRQDNLMIKGYGRDF